MNSDNDDILSTLENIYVRLEELSDAVARLGVYICALLAAILLVLWFKW